MPEQILLSHEKIATFLGGLSHEQIEQIQQYVSSGRCTQHWQQRYPEAHQVRTDRALFEFTNEIKSECLRHSSPLSRVLFDGKLQSVAKALGTNARISRVQGGKLKSKNEVRIASVFRCAPEPFLRMIVSHELAHLKIRDHSKEFYKLCTYIEPDYAQLEFQVRLYLLYLDAGGEEIWR